MVDSPTGTGIGNVTVVTAGGTASLSPIVTGISPASGPVTGGTSVTISGSNFTNATAVNFAGTAATSFIINSDTQITATSPAGTAGPVDVTVTTVGGTSATSSADQFLYLAQPPTVTGISPAAGPTAGGTTVTVTGTGFTNATAVAFGGTAAAMFVINSDTQITATSPPGTAGSADVTVISPGGTSSITPADQFIYKSPLTFGPSVLANATANQAYTTTIGASGGSGSYSFSLASGSTLPAGLSLSSSGVLGPLPTTAGSFSFTIMASDNTIGGLTGSQQFTLKVNPASILTLSPATLTPGTAGSSYGPVTLSVTGGFGSYSFALARGSTLPAGLSFTGGVLSGTPKSAGTFAFTLTATDSSNQSLTGNVKYSLKVNPALTLSPTSLATATVGNPFNVQLTATGGSGKNYSFTASGLPSGLKLSSTGLLSGTPTTAAGSPFPVTVTVADSNVSAISKSYSLTVDATLGISPALLSVATMGNKYSTQLTATGGSGKLYSFTATGLPSWLKLSSTGLLSGTPPAGTNSPVSFSVTITDSIKATGTSSYTLTVDSALTLSPNSLPVATVDNPFYVSLTAGGGSGTGYTFTATVSGKPLPSWLKLLLTPGPSIAVLSGMPTTASSTPLQVTVTDSNKGTISHAYTLTVNPALVIKPVTLPVATVGDLFRTQLTATGGSGKGYSFTASSLPSWLTLVQMGHMANGTLIFFLQGTPTSPTATGTPLQFTIAVTDSNGATGSQTYNLTVNPALVINPATLPSATLGTRYN